MVDAPYLLFLGFRSGYKNFDQLLEAYASSPALNRDFKLVCLGDGEFSAAEARRFTDPGLPSDHLVWKGGGDEVLMQLYRHAACFVYPSRYEGFGVPPLEAMAHDCPVVCSNGSSISEVVGPAGEFFDPLESGAIAAALDCALGSGNRVRELRQRGRERLAAITWDACAARTYDIYSQLL